MSTEPTWKDSTSLFQDTCKGMSLGQMIHDDMYSDYVALSAVELMEPKMDPESLGITVSTTAEEVLDMSPPLLPENPNARDLLTLLDYIVALQAAFHQGFPISATVFSCLYLHRPRSIQNPFLRAYAYATIKTCHIIFDTILRADVFDEDDFTKVRAYGGFDMLVDVSVADIIAMLQAQEDALTTHIQALKAQSVVPADPVTASLFLSLALPPEEEIALATGLAYRFAFRRHALLAHWAISHRPTAAAGAADAAAAFTPAQGVSLAAAAAALAVRTANLITLTAVDTTLSSSALTHLAQMMPPAFPFASGPPQPIPAGYSALPAEPPTVRPPQQHYERPVPASCGPSPALGVFPYMGPRVGIATYNRYVTFASPYAGLCEYARTLTHIAALCSALHQALPSADPGVEPSVFFTRYSTNPYLAPVADCTLTLTRHNPSVPLTFRAEVATTGAGEDTVTPTVTPLVVPSTKDGDKPDTAATADPDTLPSPHGSSFAATVSAATADTWKSALLPPLAPREFCYLALAERVSFIAQAFSALDPDIVARSHYMVLLDSDTCLLGVAHAAVFAETSIRAAAPSVTGHIELPAFQPAALAALEAKKKSTVSSKTSGRGKGGKAKGSTVDAATSDATAATEPVDPSFLYAGMDVRNLSLLQHYCIKAAAAMVAGFARAGHARHRQRRHAQSALIDVGYLQQDANAVDQWLCEWAVKAQLWAPSMKVPPPTDTVSPAFCKHGMFSWCFDFVAQAIEEYINTAFRLRLVAPAELSLFAWVMSYLANYRERNKQMSMRAPLKHGAVGTGPALSGSEAHPLHTLAFPRVTGQPVDLQPSATDLRLVPASSLKKPTVATPQPHDMRRVKSAADVPHVAWVYEPLSVGGSAKPRVEPVPPKLLQEHLAKPAVRGVISPYFILSRIRAHVMNGLRSLLTAMAKVGVSVPKLPQIGTHNPAVADQNIFENWFANRFSVFLRVLHPSMPAIETFLKEEEQAETVLTVRDLYKHANEAFKNARVLAQSLIETFPLTQIDGKAYARDKDATGVSGSLAPAIACVNRGARTCKVHTTIDYTTTHCGLAHTSDTDARLFVLNNTNMPQVIPSLFEVPSREALELYHVSMACSGALLGTMRAEKAIKEAEETGTAKPRYAAEFAWELHDMFPVVEVVEVRKG